MEAKKEGSDSGVSKADFIRSLGNAPAKEVVAKAKEAGITLSEAYVYKLRSNERLAAKRGNASSKAAAKKAPAPKKRAAKAPAKKGAAKAAAPKAEAPAAAPAAPARSGGKTNEEKFVDLVLELGIANSEELFAKVRSRAKSVSLR